MNQNQLTIAQMLCSRICHDIIAPVGAVNSGLELLQDSPQNDNNDIISLINSGAQSAVSKLAMFRFAFGANSPRQMSILQEVEPLIKQAFDKFNVTMDLSKPLNIHQDQVVKWAKLIMQMTMMLSEAAPYGGDISIAIDTPKSLKLKLKADKIIINETNFDILSQTTEDLNAQNIVYHMINLLMQDLGVAIKRERSSNDLIYTLFIK